MKFKIILIAFLSITALYYILSIIIFRGSFIQEHDYSYNSLSESKKEGTLVSNDLELKIEGDSLKSIKNLNEKFFSTQSTYQKFYGFLFSIDKEDENYRRIIWGEPTQLSAGRNWIIVDKDDNYLGEAFYTGHVDTKVSEIITLTVKNAKTDNKIGNIQFLVK
ncbi:hypothetical protein [Chryseobacterium sp. 3008163]|uniref:hypothetical protein n=1 Tax=Chryseobacterium sp. 3008163 TaxID=2478663 RepID=UPI000F0C9D5B|nr:hypothetical protein [Chryseobacterium sp. 3008163]AYN00633.1 hypothetical protein EAG08_10190 [Chryseobacterium sp. 3008163]